MILVVKPQTPEDTLHRFIQDIESTGLQTHLSRGKEVTIIGLIGDKTQIDLTAIEANPVVDKIIPVTESYKLANKKFHPTPTEFTVKDTKIGPNNITIMSGPCAVESEDQLLCIAKAVKEQGATILRGGAYKPRTSPYSFQGLEEEGLRYMKTASQETGLATICEVSSCSCFGI